MADAHRAGQTSDVSLVEYVPHKPVSLARVELFLRAGDYARGVLTAVLEYLGAEVLEAKLIEHCAVNLPDFKRARSVHVVDTLPRATLEKIAKKELRDRLQPITEGA